MDIETLVNRYSNELKSYYIEYENDLRSLLSRSIRSSNFLQIGRELKSLAGRLGARIAKAGQRAIRDYVLDYLFEQKQKGADLTFNVVQSIAKATTRREFYTNLVHEHFSTADRTARAEDRTRLTDDEILQLVQELRPQVRKLKRMLKIARENYSDHWRNSSLRAEANEFQKLVNDEIAKNKMLETDSV